MSNKISAIWLILSLAILGEKVMAEEFKIDYPISQKEILVFSDGFTDDELIMREINEEILTNAFFAVKDNTGYITDHKASIREHGTDNIRHEITITVKSYLDISKPPVKKK